MPSPDFLRRMENVLSARVEARKAHDAKPRRIQQVCGVIAGTLVCFFLLKAVALAHDSNAFPAPVSADAGFGAQIYQWLAGADPISGTLAAALRNGPPPGAAATGTL